MGNFSSKSPQTSLFNEDDYSSEPKNLKKHISITFDKDTGLYKGFPSEWVNIKQIPVDENETIDTGQFPMEVRAYDLPDSILALIQQKSKPIKCQHKINIEIDPDKELGLKGLTEEMIIILKNAGIKKEEILQDSKNFISVLENFHDSFEHKEKEYFTLPKPKSQDFVNAIQMVEFIDENPSDLYKFTEQLGKGACCKVYRVQSRQNSKEVFAVRVMKIRTPETVQKIKTEIALMFSLQHPCIVQYHQTFIFQNCMFMFVEYIDGGSLTELIYQFIKQFDETVISYIIGQILSGLQQLHRFNRVHRDLKSDNILLCKNGLVKIADFGYATQLTLEKDLRQSLVGTPAWMAPELIQKDGYNEKIDIWSLGIIGYELAYGEPPHLRKPPIKAMYEITSKPAPKIQDNRYSEQFKDFISQCLNKDPSQRASAQTLLQHPFIKTNNQNIGKNKLTQMISQKKNVSLKELIKRQKD